MTMKTTSLNIRLSFLPVPRINRNETVMHNNGKILLKGPEKKAEVWANSKSEAHEILGNFVWAVSNSVDPEFSAKLITAIETSATPKHPSNPDWAYSQITITNIPMLEISDMQWKSVLDQLKAIEDGTLENDLDESSRFLFQKK